MTVRVVFADDNYLVREGVAALLAEAPEVELVDAVEDAVALHRAVAVHKPDAVLTDIRMPPTFTTEGIDAAKRIRVDFPGTGVVVLSQYVEAEYAFDLLSNGVEGLGYLLKERVSDLDELVRALKEVARGGSALDPKVVEGLLARRIPDRQLGAGRADRAGDRGLQEVATGPEQCVDGQDAVHERARGGEAHRVRVPEAGARQRVRGEPAGHGGAGVLRGHGGPALR